MARRNANGEGTIYRRKDGRHEGAVYVLTTSGARKRVRVYGATRAEVHSKLTEAKAKNDQGIPAVDKAWLLGEYLDYWLEEFVRINRRPATHAQCEQIVRLYLKPGLGHHAIHRLSVPLVQAYAKKQLANGQSISQVHIIRKVLSAALTRAQREELVTRNVARLVELPKIQTNEVKPWNFGEVARFLATVHRHRLYAAFMLLVLYGPRRGEVLGLRWQDIDLEHSKIRFRQQLVRVGRSLIIGPLKTRASNRDLPLLEPLSRALRAHQAEQIARGIDSELVFTTLAGMPIEPRNFARSFERFCNQQELRVITVHALRHTAATMLKNLGVPPADAKVILGHSRITTTLELYQHGDMGTSRNALKLVEDAVLPTMKETNAAQDERAGSLEHFFDGNRCRQISRQTRKNPTLWLDSISGAGTGTLTLDLVLGKTAQDSITERVTAVREASERRTRQWIVGVVAVKLAVNNESVPR